MMKKNYVSIILLQIFIIFFSSFDGYSENNVVLKNDKVEVLPLNKFIKTTIRKDTHFKEILIENLKLKYKKDLDLDSIDVILSMLNQYEFAITDDQNSGYTNSTKLSAMFPQTGTEVSTTYTTDPGSFFTGRTSTFSLVISQAIAKNAFGHGYRLDKKIVDLEIEISKHQIIEAYEDYLSSLIGIYYQWVSNYTDLKTAEISLRENRKLLRNIQAKKRYNIAYQTDVDRIMVQVIEKNENVVLLKNKFKSTEQLIYQAIRYQGKVPLVPVFSAYNDNEIKFDDEYRRFVATSRTHSILNLIDKQGSAVIKKNVQNLFPSVNFLFGYERSGGEYSFEDPEDSIFAGFQFDFSFLQTKNRAKLKTSKAEKKRLDLDAENTKFKLETDLKKLNDEIELEKKLINSAEEKIKLGNRIFQGTLRDYRLARATLTELIEAINKLEKSKFEKVDHTIKLHTLKVEWLRLVDRLVTKVG